MSLAMLFVMCALRRGSFQSDCGRAEAAAAMVELHSRGPRFPHSNHGRLGLRLGCDDRASSSGEP
jgi:hypothetical protein